MRIQKYENGYSLAVSRDEYDTLLGALMHSNIEHARKSPPTMLDILENKRKLEREMGAGI